MDHPVKSELVPAISCNFYGVVLAGKSNSAVKICLLKSSQKFLGPRVTTTIQREPYIAALAIA